MTSPAERAHNPGPEWRHATAYDRPLPDTYIKVCAAGTQQIWVLAGERGLVEGDPVAYSDPFGVGGVGTVRVVQPGRVLVGIDASETRGYYEQWIPAEHVQRLPEGEETHD